MTVLIAGRSASAGRAARDRVSSGQRRVDEDRLGAPTYRIGFALAENVRADGHATWSPWPDSEHRRGRDWSAAVPLESASAVREAGDRGELGLERVDVRPSGATQFDSIASSSSFQFMPGEMRWVEVHARHLREPTEGA